MADGSRIGSGFSDCSLKISADCVQVKIRPVAPSFQQLHEMVCFGFVGNGYASADGVMESRLCLGNCVFDIGNNEFPLDATFMQMR